MFGLAEDELEAAVQVFHVRSGKVVGRSALFVDKVEDLTADQLMERILVDVYADPPSGVPRQVLVPLHAGRRGGGDRLPDRAAGRSGGACGSRYGDPSGPCSQTVEHNAGESFVRHRLHRTSDHNSRARALESLQRELGLPEAPLRIECYDMSHLQGTDYVGSMVVFEDGLAKKSDYRHFRVTTRGRQRRLRGHGGGPHPAADRPAGRGEPPTDAAGTAPSGPATQPDAVSPIRRSCCCSTVAWDSSTSASGCWSRWG